MEEKKKIHVCEHGPYKVTGDIRVKQTFIVPDAENQSEMWKDGKIYEKRENGCYLCRCGHSYQKPYCDGTHMSNGFTGDETATHESYEKNAKRYIGESVDMLDNKALCAVARFCDRGENAWRMVRKSSDAAMKEMAVYEACACPSGRLVITEKDGTKIEPKLEQEIGVIQDVAADCKGPLWVKGGIEIEDAKGRPYEVRNRVTLCRCGESKNMPFCDASHLECPHMQNLDK